MLKKIDKKICLAVGTAVFLAGGLIWLAVFWQLGKIREMSDNIQKEQLDSLVREERSRKILEAGKEFESVGENQERMGKMFVDRDDAVPFLRTIENIAALTGNGIKISVIDLNKMKSQSAKKTVKAEPDDESEANQKKENQAQKGTNSQGGKQDFSNQLGFLIELTGRYGSFVDFLTKLENAPYLVKVYKLQITPVVKTSPASAGGTGEAMVSPAGGDGRDVNAILTIGAYTNGGK